MDDRELLAMAAKAAGIEAQYSDNYGDFSIGDPYSKGEVRWNPITDDGDALRLAANLRIGLGDRETTVTAFYRQGMSTGSVYVEEHDTTNKARATRRAIVRAAAEVGKALSATGQ